MTMSRLSSNRVAPYNISSIGWDVVTATPAGPNVVVSWPAMPGAVAYYVQVGGQAPVYVGNVLTYTVTGLTTGTAYSFSVLGVDVNGAFSGSASGKTATPPGWNAATGGAVNDYSNYNGTGQTWRVHSFTSNGTLTVTNAGSTFNYLVIGGGGGGGNANANGYKAGNPGGFNNVTGATLSAISYSITIGGGGAGGNQGQNSPPGSGGTTTFTGVSTAGGGGGGADGLATSPNASGTSNIQGTSKTYTDYGAGGFHPSYNGSGWGSAGGSGLVVVAYRIG